MNILDEHLKWWQKQKGLTSFNKFRKILQFVSPQPVEHLPDRNLNFLLQGTSVNRWSLLTIYLSNSWLGSSMLSVMIERSKRATAANANDLFHSKVWMCCRDLVTQLRTRPITRPRHYCSLQTDRYRSSIIHAHFFFHQSASICTTFLYLSPTVTTAAAAAVKVTVDFSDGTELPASPQIHRQSDPKHRMLRRTPWCAWA